MRLRRSAVRCPGRRRLRRGNPRVVEGYESGLTIAAGARRAERTKAIRTV